MILNDHSCQKQWLSLGRTGFWLGTEMGLRLFIVCVFPVPLWCGGPWPCVPCSLCSPTPTPLSDLYHEGWTPCSHIKTLCIPHLELPLAHSLGFRVYQWVLCSAKGRTTQVKALGVGRDCLGRDSQGFSTLGSVDSLLLEGCSRKRPAAGTLKCKDVMPFCTFYFQIMWMCVFFQWIGGVQK